MKPVALFLAAIACAGSAAAYSGAQCHSYLTGKWALEGSSWMTYDFAADGMLLHSEAHASGPPDETRASWRAADGRKADGCTVTVTHDGGKTEELDFTLVDEATYRYANKTFKRLSGSGEAIRSAATAAGFDNATCPTYFTGNWRAEKTYKDGKSVMQVTFSADGTFGLYREDRGKSGTTKGEIEDARWSAAPGPAADQCSLTLTLKGGKGESMPARIRSEKSFLDEKEGYVFTRY